MGLKPDHWIRKMALEHNMIDPFFDGQKRDGIISYGLSSYGYDIRVANEFKVFTPGMGDLSLVDPKHLATQAMVDFVGDVCIIPPNSFALARSLEYMRIPRNVLGAVLGKCLTGDTRIVNGEDGSYVPIKEIKAPMIILALVDGEIKAVPASAAIYNGRKPVYLIRMKSGREIKATANHPFLTVRGWLPLSELMNGSQVAVARHIPAFGKNQLPAWEAALLGFFIAEGQCHTPGHSPVFTTTDPVLATAFEHYCRDGLNCPVTYNGNCGYRVVNHTGQGGIPEKNRATLWLKSYEMTIPAFQKFVPQAIFEADRETTIIFLQALFSGDGSVYKMAGRAFCLEYTSTSYRLIEDVRHLLLRFGISAKIWEKHPKNGRTAWTLAIHNAAQIIRFAENIGFWPGSIKQQSLETFISEIEQLNFQRSKQDSIPPDAWSHVETILAGRSLRSIGVHRHGASRKMTYEQAAVIYQATQDPFLKNIMSPDVLWDTVQSVELMGEDDVYDLSVPDHHNFIANDIVVHNSTYARCGIVTNFTPLEPGWHGFITIEISNTTPLPAKIYANEGIAQVLFFEGDEPCEVSYADKKGKYQGQQGVVLPRL